MGRVDTTYGAAGDQKIGIHTIRRELRARGLSVATERVAALVRQVSLLYFDIRDYSYFWYYSYFLSLQLHGLAAFSFL
jgi:hypothetical protein